MKKITLKKKVVKALSSMLLAFAFLSGGNLASADDVAEGSGEITFVEGDNNAKNSENAEDVSADDPESLEKVANALSSNGTGSGSGSGTGSAGSHTAGESAGATGETTQAAAGKNLPATGESSNIALMVIGGIVVASVAGTAVAIKRRQK